MSVLKIHLTYRCSAACDHCRFACSPSSGSRASGDVIDAQVALDTARELLRLNGLETVVLMGGEPGLYPALTHHLVRELGAMGLATRVETNASWATDAAAATAFLEPLYQQGASVMFSLDAFHEPHVPPERVGRAVQASQTLGGAHNIESAYLFGPRSRHPLDRRTDDLLAELDPACRVYRGPVLFVGRAARRLAPLVAPGRGVPAEPCLAVPWWSRGEQDTTDLLILDPQGYLSKGCGIALGNVLTEPVGRLLSRFDACRHPILGRLLTQGPLALAQEAQAAGLYRIKRDYADRCHLCQEAREALRPRYPQWLAPDQHYAAQAE